MIYTFLSNKDLEFKINSQPFCAQFQNLAKKVYKFYAHSLIANNGPFYKK